MTFALSGHLQAEDLPELKRVMVMETCSKPVALDLTDVKLVDRDVVTFLADFETDSGRITNCPTYIREWIRRERAQP